MSVKSSELLIVRWRMTNDEDDRCRWFAAGLVDFFVVWCLSLLSSFTLLQNNYHVVSLLVPLDSVIFRESVHSVKVVATLPNTSLEETTSFNQEYRIQRSYASLQTRTDLHPIRLLLRPTIFTVGVGSISIHWLTFLLLRLWSLSVVRLSAVRFGNTNLIERNSCKWKNDGFGKRNRSRSRPRWDQGVFEKTAMVLCSSSWEIFGKISPNLKVWWDPWSDWIWSSFFFGEWNVSSRS